MALPKPWKKLLSQTRRPPCWHIGEVCGWSTSKLPILVAGIQKLREKWGKGREGFLICINPCQSSGQNADWSFTIGKQVNNYQIIKLWSSWNYIYEWNDFLVGKFCWWNRRTKKNSMDWYHCRTWIRWDRYKRPLNMIWMLQFLCPPQK